MLLIILNGEIKAIVGATNRISALTRFALNLILIGQFAHQH